MGVPSASGHPQLSGTFIPEIWAGKILTKFYAATNLSEFCNTDYEGEISSQGDKVIIRQDADIEIRDYTKGQTLVRQNPSAPNKELLVDKALYWNVGLDTIDRRQSDLPLEERYTNDAARQLKIEQERRVWADVYADAHAANSGASAGLQSGGINLGVAGTPLALTTSNIVEFLVNVGTVLDEQDVPEEDRRILLPWWAINLVKRSELKDASLSGDSESPLRNGRAGRVDRLTLYGSSLVSSVIDGADRVWNVIGTQKSGISWASQITETEKGKSEQTFGDYVRGLAVYGYEVLKPEAVVHAYVKKG